MCIENTLQQIIQQRTGGGEIIADFLFDTVEGKTPAVKTCHQLEAAKYLIRIGYPSDHTATDDRHSREASPRSGSGNPVAQTAQTSLRCQTTIPLALSLSRTTSSRHSRGDDNPSLTRHSRASGNPEARDEDSSLSSDNPARPDPVEGPVDAPKHTPNNAQAKSPTWTS